MNVNGLTFDRWYAAATFGVPDGRKPRPADMIDAWKRGEDPTEHAAALAGPPPPAPRKRRKSKR